MSHWALLSKKFLQIDNRRHLVDIGRLPLFFLIAVLVVFFMRDSKATAEGLLFQSPPASPPTAQPPPQPTATPLPPPTATPVPAEPVTSEPVSGPTAEPVQVESTEVEQTTEEQIIPAEPEPTAEPPTEQQSDGQTSAPPPELTTEGAVPPGPQPQPISLGEREEIFDEAAEEPRNLILDQAELIDTVAVFGAYLWLCCGIGLLLLAPLFLLLLYVRGRSKILQENNW